ncbi:MAG: HmuY family protein, partial [Gemmatimonadales bacterium]
DSLNPVLARWYRYSMVSHLLEPKHRTYVVRTREGRYAKLQFVSYYCPGPTAGCVTFRYAFILRPPSRPGDGWPALP